MVTLYSTGCINCRALMAQLDRNNIKYDVISDVDKMLAIGITEVPMLKVNDNIMNKTEAMNWIKERNNK